MESDESHGPEGAADADCMTPEDMLCFDVYALQQAFGRVYKPLLAPLDLTYPQYLVMSCLWSDSPAHVGRLRARLGLETSTLTPVLKRLETAGLVTRRRDADDERRVFVGLTERGAALAERAAHIPGCITDATGMGEAEIAALRVDLKRLRMALTDAVPE